MTYNGADRKQLKQLVEDGIRAAKAGQNDQAIRLLKQALNLDDQDETAWLWLASAVESPGERRICLENVLQINPDNVVARRALDRLDAQTAARQAQPTTGETAVDRFLFSDFAPQADASPGSEPDSAIGRRNSSASSASGSNTSRSTRVQRSRILALLLAIVVVGIMIVLVGINLVASQSGCCTVTPDQTLTPAHTSGPTLAFIAQAQTIDAETLTVPPSPHGTIQIVLPPTVGITTGPTWTPPPTFTSPPNPTATATPLPLGSLTLIFAGEGRGRSASALYQVNADGTHEALLLGVNEPLSDPAWSSDGKQVAYVQSINGLPQLMVAMADGSHPHPLTHLSGSYLRLPSWSSDDQQIVFAATFAAPATAGKNGQTGSPSGHTALYMVNVAGGDPVALTDGTFDCHDPAWSPDGKQIAYAADMTGSGAFQVYTLDRSTGKSQQLTDSAKSNYSPAWSADGSRIAFVSTRDGSANLYTMNADGSEQKLISYDAPTAENRDPSWSPDGRWLAFSSNRAGGFAIYIMAWNNGQTAGATRLTDPAQQSFTPRFRPKV